MEYTIFPMAYINITQRVGGTTSHTFEYQGVVRDQLAIDIGGVDSGIDFAYAPTTCKVEKIIGTTVYFSSCDRNGYYKKVKCADGQERYLTYALTHIDNTSSCPVNKIFLAGDKFYQEGSSGGAKANHIHLEVANGSNQSKTGVKIRMKQSDGSYKLEDGLSFVENALNPRDIFFGLEGLTTINYNDSDSANFLRQTIRNRNGQGTGGDCFLKAVNMGFNLRVLPSSSSNTRGMVPKGSQARVLSFQGFQSDGYQWAMVSYNGTYGYAQIDLKNCYQLAKNSGYNMIMYAVGDAFRIRSTTNHATVLEVVPKGDFAYITGFPNSFDSNDSGLYQYAFTYKTQYGKSQLDTKGYYLVDFIY
ncbi:SH3 domain-containing protein [Anaerorhabdus furcosa]|uniref:SH3b domain-containing protein n=1 Tax=Anaerorhabdus furcosa TaxID=118967 RepID=A0A1T4LEQ5_9FIRM|nr:SH3 domain-containing protein [Anaerorhabdus furcosa]SJZ53038.1 hypothetical protein SAMN02745191_0849 [Anaerorhabdus furcosa]